MRRYYLQPVYAYSDDGHPILGELREVTKDQWLQRERECGFYGGTPATAGFSAVGWNGSIAYEGPEDVREEVEEAIRDGEKEMTSDEPFTTLGDVVDGPITTASGRVLEDSDIEALADEAERGYDIDPAKATKWPWTISITFGAKSEQEATDALARACGEVEGGHGVVVPGIDPAPAVHRLPPDDEVLG